jgi:hypothetical protein
MKIPKIVLGHHSWGHLRDAIINDSNVDDEISARKS